MLKFKASLFKKIFALLPVWLVHLGSNKFLDSDLAFLHFQEQNVRQRGATAKLVSVYFMPAASDRCIAALRKWLERYAHVLAPLPPSILTRAELFDRWTQHTAHCRHCQAAVAGIARWRKRLYAGLALSLLGAQFWAARLFGVACLGGLGLLALVDQQFRVSDYKHYQNQ